MKKIQQSDVNMMDATKSFINSSIAANLLVLPNFATWNTAFNATLAHIFVNMESQGLNRKGFRITKNSLRKDLSLLSVNYAAILMSYATVINDMVLFHLMDIKKSNLDRATDLELIPIIQSIIDALTENLAALSIYNITPATLTDYTAIFNNYKIARPKTRLGIADKKDATKKIAMLITVAKQTLANLDGVVKTIQITNPDLLDRYLNVRKIVDLPTTKLSARVKLVDQDGQPLPFAHIKSIVLGIDRKASKNGTFTLINIDEGRYIFEFSTPGFKTIKVTIIITVGQRKELTFTLNPE